MSLKYTHALASVVVVVVNHFQTSSLKPLDQSKPNFMYVEPPLEGGTKVCINDPGHITKMATSPYMVKTF